jgi:hypothetical protein
MNATRARVQRKRVCTTSYAVGVLDRSLYGVFFRNKHKLHTRMSNHSYKYTYAHSISISNFERLSCHDLEIYKVDY